MQFISYGRRGGKTVWLMNKMKEDPNGIMVCIHQAEINRLMREYPEVAIGRFVTVEEIHQGKLRGLNSRPNLYIDNLDMILARWLGEYVAWASVTSDV